MLSDTINAGVECERGLPRNFRFLAFAVPDNIITYTKCENTNDASYELSIEFSHFNTHKENAHNKRTKPDYHF